MYEITRSIKTMVLLAVGAGLYALGSALGVIGWATLDLRNYNVFKDLQHGLDWLHFAGLASALAGLAVVGWELLPRRQTEPLAELTGAIISTLMITIGALIQAASGSTASAANIVAAIGIGGWALQALFRAARYNLAPPDQPAIRSFATPWLTVSGGLLLFAIGTGFTVTITNRGTAIASAVLEAIGAAVLAQVLIAARARHYLATSATFFVILGLLIISASFVTAAVVAGIEFSRHGTVTGLRVGLSLVGFISTIGTLFFAAAAWTQVRKLAGALGPSPASTGWAMPRFSPPPPAPPGGDAIAPPEPASAPPEPASALPAPEASAPPAPEAPTSELGPIDPDPTRPDQHPG